MKGISFSEQWRRELNKLRAPGDCPSPNYIRVLFAVSNRGSGDGTGCYAANETYALESGQSVSTVERAIKWARGADWLQLVRQGGGRGRGTIAGSFAGNPNEYSLRLPLPLHVGDGVSGATNPVTQVTTLPARKPRQIDPFTPSDRADTPSDRPLYPVTQVTDEVEEVEKQEQASGTTLRVEAPYTSGVENDPGQNGDEDELAARRRDPTTIAKVVETSLAEVAQRSGFAA
jgi:hypothetical protein